MKLNFDKAQCFFMPAKFYQLINTEIAKVTPTKTDVSTITLNFRDPSYSSEHGGYHPVEVRLERHNLEWKLVYVTDFSFQGTSFPDLIKEIDICFLTNQVYSLFSGWLNNKSGKELITLFVDNFIEYHALDTYQVSVSFD